MSCVSKLSIWKQGIVLILAWHWFAPHNLLLSFASQTNDPNGSCKKCFVHSLMKYPSWNHKQSWSLVWESQECRPPSSTTKSLMIALLIFVGLLLDDLLRNDLLELFLSYHFYSIVMLVTSSVRLSLLPIVFWAITDIIGTW